MGTLQTRLRDLEQATTDKAPLLIYVPDGAPAAEQQREIDEAKQAGRAVVIVTDTDAAL